MIHDCRTHQFIRILNGEFKKIYGDFTFLFSPSRCIKQQLGHWLRPFFFVWIQLWTCWLFFFLMLSMNLVFFNYFEFWKFHFFQNKEKGQISEIITIFHSSLHRFPFWKTLRFFPFFFSGTLAAFDTLASVEEVEHGGVISKAGSGTKPSSIHF